ncbi:MAG TPA: L,D-transpeptidase family protein [Aestuariivirga sp.]
MFSQRFTRRAILGAVGLAAAASVARAQSTIYTASITSITPRLAVAGKLATKTEFLADRDESAMVTSGSIRALEGAIQMYEEIVAGGGWPSIDKGKLEKGAKSDLVLILRQRLMTEGYLPFDDFLIETPDVFDDSITGALQAFQSSHGIAPSGKIDERTRAELNITARARLQTLRENYPRVGEYALDLHERNILVNIPSAQLETVEYGKVRSRHNVVVGKLQRPSPALKSIVSDINFNPYWSAPASIVQKDLVPKFLKDPTIFEQMNIRIFDGVGGPEIDPYTIDWINTAPDRYVFRQEPGEQNALATMKINFANKHMVYMHDTPHRELFEVNARFESSGCVRVDKVSTVVDWILGGQDGIDATEIEMITASQQPYDVKVANPPDVRFMYLTAWATEDGRVNFRPDIYSLDGTGFVLGQPRPSRGI